MFTSRFARRSARRYRSRGLDRVERRMVAHAVEQGVDGARVLEIGGGVGKLQLELVKAGATSGEVVEVVSAYEPFARELAVEADVAERTTFRVVDVLEQPERIEPADLVLLNRVVCCSPDGVELASEAARHTRRALVLSYPRDLLPVRLAVGLQNLAFRALRRTFRVFVHPPDALAAAAEAAGLHVVATDRLGAWEVTMLRRAP